MREKLRNSLVRLASNDIVEFLEDHEEELLETFREELQALDDSLPEERMFIDIRMVALGDALMLSVLRAIKKFIRSV